VNISVLDIVGSMPAPCLSRRHLLLLAPAPTATGPYKPLPASPPPPLPLRWARRLYGQAEEMTSGATSPGLPVLLLAERHIALGDDVAALWRAAAPRAYLESASDLAEARAEAAAALDEALKGGLKGLEG